MFLFSVAELNLKRSKEMMPVFIHVNQQIQMNGQI